MAKFCSHCGNPVNENETVCHNCGYLISSPEEGRPLKTVSSALILGIIGIIFAWLFALVGHITSIIGITIGVREYNESGKIAGLVLSIVGEVCAVISSIIGAAITVASML